MPNTREKLIELRREGEEIAENFCVSRQECYQCPYNTWIPVAERLPEEGVEVLAFGYWHENFQPLMCYLSPHRKGKWFTTVAGQQVYTVTHWMPLPEPSKGE